MITTVYLQESAEQVENSFLSVFLRKRLMNSSCHLYFIVTCVLSFPPAALVVESWASHMLSKLYLLSCLPSALPQPHALYFVSEMGSHFAQVGLELLFLLLHLSNS